MTDLSLFAQAIVKCALVTGIGPGILLLIWLRVSGDRQLAQADDFSAMKDRATSLPRNQRRAA